MAKFNKVEKVITHEGGKGYMKSDLQKLFNYLCGQFANEVKFYRDSSNDPNEIRNIVKSVSEQYGIGFVAKLAVFARNVIGVRSSSHLIAAILNGEKFDGKRDFFRDVCHRVDDVAEIMAAIDQIGGKRSHAMVRGCADYLSTCNEYQIGKYKMGGRKYNLYDVINLTHANSPAIDKYKQGVLETPETWEVKISAASCEEERNAEWINLLMNNKLGYLALLRNIRNIDKAIYCLDSSEEACAAKIALSRQLTNEEAIRKSLVFPFQIYTAYKNGGQEYSVSLEKAFKISTQNMPDLDGHNTVIVDLSGSMTCPMSANNSLSYADISAVYAYAICVKSNYTADIIKFGTGAKRVCVDRNKGAFYNIDMLKRNDGVGHSTNLSKALEITNPSDRVFIFSDCQSMDGQSKGIMKEWSIYWNNPVHVYNFDLGNYHSMSYDPKSKDIHYVEMTSLGDTAFKLIEYGELSEDDFVEFIMNYRVA